MRVDWACGSLWLASLSLSLDLHLLPKLHEEHQTIAAVLNEIFCGQSEDMELVVDEGLLGGHTPARQPEDLTHAAVCASLHSQLQQLMANDENKPTLLFSVVSEDVHRYSKQSIVYWSEVCGFSDSLSVVYLAPPPYTDARSVGQVEDALQSSHCFEQEEARGDEEVCDHVCTVRRVHLASALRGLQLHAPGPGAALLDMHCVEDFLAAGETLHPQARWVFVPSLVLRPAPFSAQQRLLLFHELQQLLLAARN
eukprot:gene40980-49987_t